MVESVARESVCGAFIVNRQYTALAYASSRTAYGTHVRTVDKREKAPSSREKRSLRKNVFRCYEVLRARSSAFSKRSSFPAHSGGAKSELPK